MLNKVMLIGNLGKDPEVRDIGEGIKVAKFSLATSERFKDRGGVQQTRTEWHNIVLWRGLADVSERFLKKGMSVYIEGRITSRSYQDKDGITKYFTEIVGQNMQMLGKKGDAPNFVPEPDPVVQKPLENSSPQVENTTIDGAVEDDMPF